MDKINQKITKRIDWVDQLRGFAIFLVVYGHNFPVTEKYIYSFHMPLFIFLSGMFHPKEIKKHTIINRVKRVLVPYFIWSFVLFIFWFLIGRNYGESAKLNLSVLKNLIGVFYAQGGVEYMDWGIPMWFLPSIFLTFLFFGIAKKSSNIYTYIILISFIIVGFLLPFVFSKDMPWSLDIAMVSLLFYGLGYYFKSKVNSFNTYLLIFVGLLHFLTFRFNTKVDIYRSNYGDILFFIINGVLGISFYIGLFKLLPEIKWLSYLGKNTISILALQIRAMTFIKLVLLILMGIHIYSFNEFQKFYLAIFQVLLILPVAFFINKYLPILNGVSKK